MRVFICFLFLLSFGVSNAQDNEKDNYVSFNAIQEPPIYPGCQGKPDALKKCFTRAMQMHMAKNFNAELINNPAYNSVNKKMFILFVVDKEGNVKDIEVKRAPHERLVEESKRVISLLPKMTSARVNGKSVAMKYVLPFSMKSKTNQKKK